MPQSNQHFHNAHKAKNDEFYTRYEDIESELAHYRSSLADKTVYCNCDEYSKSQFYKYFKDNFHSIGLKKLVATHHQPRTVDILFGATDKAKKAVYDGQIETVSDLSGDGDFRSAECIDILQEADAVITNPPFSKFISFFDTLMEYEKEFLVLGSINAIIYQTIFPYIQKNEVMLGHKLGAMTFDLPDGGQKAIAVGWYGNIKGTDKEFLELTKTYSEDRYPKYDNFAAIEVNKTTNIPKDYAGVMGVAPSPFMKYYNPEQFELLASCTRTDDNGYRTKWYKGPLSKRDPSLVLRKGYDWDAGAVLRTGNDLKVLFARILIRNKKPVPRA